MKVAIDGLHRLNAICPYFTMFPLSFPLDVLRSGFGPRDRVLDPFCGRGTTNMAARLLGLWSLGVDSSPVAAAITAAKLVRVSPEAIATETRNILGQSTDVEVPSGEFWEWAFHRETLQEIAKLRAALSEDCSAPERIAVRGLVLGALHGPRTKGLPSHLSNQSPRTYAPKPAYAVRFWKARKMSPPRVAVAEVIERRARRYYSNELAATGHVLLADSREPSVLETFEQPFHWIITSPPYYGMRTYVPDQWLRNWFVGGPAEVEYSARSQLSHRSPEDFARDLRAVWRNAAAKAAKGATLVIRFGGISDRTADPTGILLESLEDTAWRVKLVRDAGKPNRGRRQADTFLKHRPRPSGEIDVWAYRT